MPRPACRPVIGEVVLHWTMPLQVGRAAGVDGAWYKGVGQALAMLLRLHDMSCRQQAAACCGVCSDLLKV